MLLGIIATVAALTVGLAFFSHLSGEHRNHSHGGCLPHNECEDMQSIPTPHQERNHSLMGGPPLSGCDNNRDRENSMRR